MFFNPGKTRAHALHYPIQDLLRACNLPYRVVGDRSDFYARSEILAALGYLELALDPTNTHALESILNYPPTRIGVRLRRQLRGENALAWKHLEDVAGDPPSFPPQLVLRAQELLAFRKQGALIVEANETTSHKIDRLLSLAGIPSYLESEGDFQGMRALRNLAASAAEYESLAKLHDWILHGRGSGSGFSPG